MNTPLDNASEPELIARLRQRDRLALADLVRLHGGKMYGVALQFMRNEHDAQEVMQDALVAVWRKIESFEGRSAFPSWLYRVTANAALMALRKRKKHDADLSLDADAAAGGGAGAAAAALERHGASAEPGETLGRAELRERVLAAVNSLEEPYRTAVLLRDVEETPIAEIATLTEVSEAAVKSRIHRGRLALRKLLLPYLNSASAGR